MAVSLEDVAEEFFGAGNVMAACAFVSQHLGVPVDESNVWEALLDVDMVKVFVEEAYSSVSRVSEFCVLVLRRVVEDRWDLLDVEDRSRLVDVGLHCAMENRSRWGAALASRCALGNVSHPVEDWALALVGLHGSNPGILLVLEELCSGAEQDGPGEDNPGSIRSFMMRDPVGGLSVRLGLAALQGKRYIQEGSAVVAAGLALGMGKSEASCGKLPPSLREELDTSSFESAWYAAQEGFPRAWIALCNVRLPGDLFLCRSKVVANALYASPVIHEWLALGAKAALVDASVVAHVIADDRPCESPTAAASLAYILAVDSKWKEWDVRSWMWLMDRVEDEDEAAEMVMASMARCGREDGVTEVVKEMIRRIAGGGSSRGLVCCARVLFRHRWLVDASTPLASLAACVLRRAEPVDAHAVVSWSALTRASGSGVVCEAALTSLLRSVQIGVEGAEEEMRGALEDMRGRRRCNLEVLQPLLEDPKASVRLAVLAWEVCDFKAFSKGEEVGHELEAPAALVRVEERVVDMIQRLETWARDQGLPEGAWSNVDDVSYPKLPAVLGHSVHVAHLLEDVTDVIRADDRKPHEWIAEVGIDRLVPVLACMGRGDENMLEALSAVLEAMASAGNLQVEGRRRVEVISNLDEFVIEGIEEGGGGDMLFGGEEEVDEERRGMDLIWRQISASLQSVMGEDDANDGEDLEEDREARIASIAAELRAQIHRDEALPTAVFDDQGTRIVKSITAAFGVLVTQAQLGVATGVGGLEACSRVAADTCLLILRSGAQVLEWMPSGVFEAYDDPTGLTLAGHVLRAALLVSPLDCLERPDVHAAWVPAASALLPLLAQDRVSASPREAAQLIRRLSNYARFGSSRAAQALAKVLTPLRFPDQDELRSRLSTWADDSNLWPTIASDLVLALIAPTSREEPQLGGIGPSLAALCLWNWTAVLEAATAVSHSESFHSSLLESLNHTRDRALGAAIAEQGHKAQIDVLNVLEYLEQQANLHQTSLETTLLGAQAFHELLCSWDQVAAEDAANLWLLLS